MQKFDVVIALEGVREAKAEWAKAVTKFNADVEYVMARLLHEAARNYMSAEEVAKASGFTVKRVRTLMRAAGLDPRSGKTLLAKKAAEALADNAALLGIEPHEMDLMSPLAYLPMGEKMRRELQERSVSQVTEMEGEHDAFYEEHYPDWNVHELSLSIYVPNKGTAEEALELVTEILDGASFDIRVTAHGAR